MIILIEEKTHKLKGCIKYGLSFCPDCYWDKPDLQFEPCDGKKAHISLLYELKTGNKNGSAIFE